MGRGTPFLSIRCSLSAWRTALPTPHKKGPNRFSCVPICRLRCRRCRNGGTHTRKRHIKSPWGEVPERSEGGGEAREGESGRATAGSDKRPRPSNTHEQWRQREAVMFVEASSKGLRDGNKADGFADTAQITQGGVPPYLRARCVLYGRAALPWIRPYKALRAVIILGSPPPLGGGRTGWVRAAAPAGWSGGRLCRGTRPATPQGLPTAPIMGGAEGGFAGRWKQALRG